MTGIRNGPDVGRITASEGQVGPLPSGTFPPDVGPWGSATGLRKGTPMQGFKDFLFHGNLIELAVAFIIGGAFATVVKGFTEIIIEILTRPSATYRSTSGRRAVSPRWARSSPVWCRS